MAGVLIYKNSSDYHSYIITDDIAHEDVKKDIIKNNYKVLWERANVNLQQIESAEKTKINLITRLNSGEKVDLEKELSSFFK